MKFEKSCETCSFSMYNDKGENICAGDYYNEPVPKSDADFDMCWEESLLAYIDRMEQMEKK